MLPADARLMVPVLAPTGGAGRSTLAFLLASELAATGDTVVLDTAPRLASPWPAWIDAPGGSGLSALPPAEPASREAVRAACAAMGGSTGRWELLTDGRDWSAPPLDLPPEPAAWYQLAALGGWQAVVADTAHPVTHDLLAARCAGLPGQTRAWLSLPYAVPVLCAAASAEGVQALQQAVMAMSAENLPLHRVVAVLVATGDGRLPPVVRAAATMLSGRTADVVHLPYDANLRASGLRTGRVHARTRQAAARIAAAVLGAAHESWGAPLPPAPQPAVLRPVSPVVPA
ncbi:hypothetical protein [Streptomyces sp. NBC_00091]|uniref:hypothetical protein n=1 Tax=Streptomyces sp. NBC_00091 TaxID=2975648 RepID=UPI002259F39B|nr:hypothetical protein [Streptomyces sp. NBC_00091]MCX5374965.1 hypothetical protein [Streptomyces sp. NBC_00091]